MVVDQLARRPDEPELSRDLGLYAVFTTATGTMIGAGIFILPGVAAAGAGPAASLSFLLAGLIAGMAALSVCELATAMPRAGGPYFFVSRAMGPQMGSIVGLGGWFALIFKGAFALVGLGQYLSHFSPVPVVGTAVAGGLLLLATNLVGARASGVLQNVIVVGLLAILGVFVVRGLGAADAATLRPFLPEGWTGVFSTTGVVFISYLGIVKAAAVAEEVRNPERNLPLGLLSSVVLVTLLYVGTMLIVTGVLPLPQLVASSAPVAEAAAVFLGATGGAFVGIAGILATLSTGNAAILSSSRYPFAMARDGLMSPWIRRIHPRFQTPVRSITITGAIMVGLVLVLDVEGLAKLGGVFGMVVFALVNLAVLQLRWTRPAWYQPTFRVPLFPFVPALGALAALAPIVQLDRTTQLAAGAFVLAGIAWYHVRRRAARAGGPQIFPEYGLFDKVREIREVQALEEKRRALAEPAAPAAPDRGAILVELLVDRPNRHLLALAAALARRYETAVDAVVVTEVPEQSPLGDALPPPPEAWLTRMHRHMAGHGVELRIHPVWARDRARAILAQAHPDTRALLLGWHEAFHPVRLRGTHVDAVLRSKRLRVGVLKVRGTRRIDRVLVATAGSPYATAEVEIADAIADMMGAKLTLLMVLPPDASAGRQDQARHYLERLDDLTRAETECRVERDTDVVEAILRAGEDADLIVLGATREPRLRHFFTGHLVGPIADEIARRSEGSVLVTRDPSVAGRARTRIGRWWREVAAGWAGVGRAPGGDAPVPLAGAPERSQAGGPEGTAPEGRTGNGER